MDNSTNQTSQKNIISTDKNKQYHLGVIYLIISAFFFALMAVFIRLAGDVPTIEKAFFRNLVALFMAASMLTYDVKIKHEKININKKAWPAITARSVLGTIGVFCNFYAVDHLVLADAAILNKMSPFFAVVGSYFILKEKFTLQQGLAVFIAFVGGLFVVKPSFTDLSFMPALIALVGGVAAGIAYTYLRKAGMMGVKGPFVVLCFAGFSCLLCIPLMMFDFKVLSMYELAMLMCTGACAAGGQFAITAAYYHAPAKEISIFDYTQLIFSTMMGFFIFGQVPDHWSVVGYAIIVAMALWMFFYNKNKNDK